MTLEPQIIKKWMSQVWRSVEMVMVLNQRRKSKLWVRNWYTENNGFHLSWWHALSWFQNLLILLSWTCAVYSYMCWVTHWALSLWSSVLWLSNMLTKIGNTEWTQPWGQFDQYCAAHSLFAKWVNGFFIVYRFFCHSMALVIIILSTTIPLCEYHFWHFHMGRFLSVIDASMHVFLKYMKESF